LLVLALAGCTGDHCERGAARCLDGVAENCKIHDDPPDSGWSWAEEACDAGTTCAVAAGQAVCALATSPDPACTSSAGWATACVTNSARTWIGCLPIAEQACDAGTCIDPTGSSCDGYGAFCASSAAPDPLCANAATACADASTLITCHCGYRVAVEPCPTATPRCVTSGNPVEGACQ
jgi:hypothetical protein